MNRSSLEHALRPLKRGASILALGMLLAGCATTPPANNQAQNTTDATTGTQSTASSDSSGQYDKYETTKEAVDFLGGSAEGIAKLMDRAFSDYGRPNAYIEGEEGGGAIAIGVRYGQGELVTKSGQRIKVYWQGPSIGWDFGADAGKVFMLVYNLPETALIYQRFAGVSGSLYVVGGLGMNYLASQDIVVAPIRVGVGLHLGAAVGYLQFTQQRSYNPF